MADDSLTHQNKGIQKYYEANRLWKDLLYSWLKRRRALDGLSKDGGRTGGSDAFGCAGQKEFDANFTEMQ